jgi:hypothetical protein
MKASDKAKAAHKSRAEARHHVPKPIVKVKTGKASMKIEWWLVVVAFLLAVLTMITGCVSVDIGVAKVGIKTERARFANGGVEIDGTGYVYFTPIQGFKALLNMGVEGSGENVD